ncbi:MAG: tRNA 2-thiouridine(34) synthase MnmA [Polyangiales bacterium]
MPALASQGDPGHTSRVSPYVDRLELLPQGARVLVGLSGSVDSSVAAALLQERGFDVVCVSLHLWEPKPGDGEMEPSRCCAPSDLDDAARTADAIGVPHFTFERLAAFESHVVKPFVDAYVAGSTPSPCVACNRDVKIGAFVALARRLGAVAFATGHYARSGSTAREGGRPALLRAIDSGKDQSYFLHGIGTEALSMLATPLGELHKTEVRAIARRHALPNADKPDSEDLCFTGGDHAGFVERRAADRVRPGPIVDADGRVVGTHAGVHRFTIGQRKGVGVALGKPAFVAAIDADTATVRLGDPGDLQAREAVVRDVAWIDRAALEHGPRRVTARIRYRHAGAPATIERVIEHGTETTRVLFDTPARAVTPGQTCVFYDGDEVLGGGTLAHA